MSSTFDLSLFFSGTKIECSLNIIYFNRGEWKIIGESRSVFERQKTGSQRDFISPCRDDVTRRNRRRGWIGLEGKFWLKDGRVGHRWDFCQRVSRKIARLVKKLLLEEAASFATYIFRTRPSFSYLSLSLSLSSNSSDVDEKARGSLPRFLARFRFPTRGISREGCILLVFASASNKRTRMYIQQVGLELFYEFFSRFR